MKLEFQYAFRDYHEANRAHLKSRPLQYYGLWTVAVASILAGLMGLEFFSNKYAAITALALGGIMILSLTSLYRRRVARVWRASRNLHLPVTADVTADGLRVRNANGESNITWRTFTGFIETPELFLVYQSSRLFTMFPKRAFRNDARMDEFRELLRSRVAQRPETSLPRMAAKLRGPSG